MEICGTRLPTLLVSITIGSYMIQRDEALHITEPEVKLYISLEGIKYIL